MEQGGQETEARSRTVAAGVFVACKDRKEIAFLFSRVPGRQTVPRSELWALLTLMRRMRTQGSYKVYIDASYVINGLQAKTKNYSKGNTGDIWTRIFAELDRIGDVEAIKVKSHVVDNEQWKNRT